MAWPEPFSPGPRAPRRPSSTRTWRARVVVMTNIANEPDDQMSLVRFLLYSNQWDVEGLVATTSDEEPGPALMGPTLLRHLQAGRFVGLLERDLDRADAVPAA